MDLISLKLIMDRKEKDYLIEDNLISKTSRHKEYKEAELIYYRQQSKYQRINNKGAI